MHACITCKAEKKSGEFYPTSNGRPGRNGECKACHIQRSGAAKALRTTPTAKATADHDGACISSSRHLVGGFCEESMLIYSEDFFSAY